MSKFSKLFKITTLVVLLCLLCAPIAVHAEAQATIWTDKPDYRPEETVAIFGSGFQANAAVSVGVTRPDSHIDVLDAIADDSGNFVTEYQLDGITGTYTITATDGTNTATATFTDAGGPDIPTVSYDDATYTITVQIKDTRMRRI